jgi:hypothetical protein
MNNIPCILNTHENISISYTHEQITINTYISILAYFIFVNKGIIHCIDINIFIK